MNDVIRFNFPLVKQGSIVLVGRLTYIETLLSTNIISAMAKMITIILVTLAKAIVKLL